MRVSVISPCVKQWPSGYNWLTSGALRPRQAPFRKSTPRDFFVQNLELSRPLQVIALLSGSGSIGRVGYVCLVARRTN